MLPQFRRSWIFGVLSASLIVAARGVDSVKVESEIELPKYVVTDTRPLPKPESWRYVELPGFEVLSNASDRNTKAILEEFRLFERALSVVWPALQGKSQVPVTLLLCDKNKFDAFMPETTRSKDAVQGAASVFFDNGPRSAIVIDMGTAVLNLSADSTTLSSSDVQVSGVEIDHSAQLKREYVRLLMSRVRPRWPAWVEEGIAQLVRGMEITDKRIQFAKLEDPNEISISQSFAIEEARQNAEAGIDIAVSAPAEDRGFQAALARSALMGFPEMFAVQRDSALAQNPVGSSWAKQCYAFVHMCLYGEGQRYQKGFLQFITRLSKGEQPSEEIFKECFGSSYRSMGASLRGYIGSAAYKIMEWNAIKGSKGFADFSPITLREATQAEVGRIKGETYALSGHNTAAQVELITAYRRGERDARLLAALGLFENNGGDPVKARKFLETAVTQQVPRAEAYLALARLRFAEADQAAGGGKSFKSTEVAAISAMVHNAIKLPPTLPENFELLADTWERSPDKISKEETTLLVRACVVFPTRLRLIYQTARFCADVGMDKEAHALVEHGITHAASEEARKNFRELQATLPALPVSPVPKS